jgi:peptide/nickel transport system substrate-binding protein
MSAWFGWPDAPKLEAMRNQWLREPDLVMRKALARDIQLQAFQDVPCVPLGLYYQPTAYRSDLVDIMKGLILFTSIRRV